MDLKYINFKKRDRIGWVQFNRPEKLNALNPNVLRDIEKAVVYCEEDNSIRVVVLKGSDKAFVAGADIENMAKEDTRDQDFLEFIVKGLVDHPEDVKIERKVDEMGVLLILKVHPEDMGQIIGRGGATARSIRSLVRIVGLRNHARVNLKIEEPEGRVDKPSVKEGLEDLKL